MKLRFPVNQAESLRRGIDAPTSTACIDIDPASLTASNRDLIADRLRGIDVMVSPAHGPTLEDLIAALIRDKAPSK